MIDIFEEYYNTLPLNENFANTKKVNWYFEFVTTEFKEGRNEIQHEGIPIAHLFRFDKDSTDKILDRIGKKTLLRELGKKPDSIFGLQVLPNVSFPVHLDMNENRVQNVYNVMISGKDSKTQFWDDQQKLTLEMRGIHEYHFNPNLIIHSATTKKEHLRLIQFFY